MKASLVTDILIDLISTFYPSHLWGLGVGCPDILEGLLMILLRIHLLEMKHT